VKDVKRVSFIGTPYKSPALSFDRSGFGRNLFGFLHL